MTQDQSGQHQHAPTGWRDQAREAERRRDWETAIALVKANAECGSATCDRSHNHLWHLHLLARAGYLPDLRARAATDVHARRILGRFLADSGRAEELRTRAEDGDRYALLKLVHMLLDHGDQAEAAAVAERIAPGDQYIAELLAGQTGRECDGCRRSTATHVARQEEVVLALCDCCVEAHDSAEGWTVTKLRSSGR